MTAFLDFIAQSPVSDYMRQARWGYAAASTAHVFGISLLVGSIAALDLRLLGLWRSEPLGPFTRVLPKVAMTGLGLAVVAGFLLFSVRPAEYAANPAFQIKIALVTLATLLAAVAQSAGILHNGSALTRTMLGAVSLGCWTAALISGRLIAFVGD